MPTDAAPSAADIKREVQRRINGGFDEAADALVDGERSREDQAVGRIMALTDLYIWIVETEHAADAD